MVWKKIVNTLIDKTFLGKHEDVAEFPIFAYAVFGTLKDFENFDFEYTFFTKWNRLVCISYTVNRLITHKKLPKYWAPTLIFFFTKYLEEMEHRKAFRSFLCLLTGVSFILFLLRTKLVEEQNIETLIKLCAPIVSLMFWLFVGSEKTTFLTNLMSPSRWKSLPLYDVFFRSLTEHLILNVVYTVQATRSDTKSNGKNRGTLLVYILSYLCTIFTNYVVGRKDIQKLYDTIDTFQEVSTTEKRNVVSTIREQTSSIYITYQNGNINTGVEKMQFILANAKTDNAYNELKTTDPYLSTISEKEFDTIWDEMYLIFDPRVKEDIVFDMISSYPSIVKAAINITAGWFPYDSFRPKEYRNKKLSRYSKLGIGSLLGVAAAYGVGTYLDSK